MPTRHYSDGEETQKRMSLRSQARHAAVRRLREKYADEFDAFYEEERIARGLPPMTQTAELKFLRRRLAELQAHAIAVVQAANNPDEV